MVRYHINLLPWREEIKRKRKIRLALATCGLYPLLTALYFLVRFFVFRIVDTLSFLPKHFSQFFEKTFRNEREKCDNDTLSTTAFLELKELSRYKEFMPEEDFYEQKELILQKNNSRCIFILEDLQELESLKDIMSEEEFRQQRELIIAKHRRLDKEEIANSKSLSLSDDLQELDNLRYIISEKEFHELKDDIIAKHVA